MKTNYKNILQMVFGMFMLVVLTACPANNNGNNGGGGPIVPPGVCQPGMVNCFGPGGLGAGGGVALDKGLGQSAVRDVSLALRFSAIGGTLSQDGLIPYTGPYIAQGELQLTNIISSACPLPPGMYQVQGQAVSGWQLGANINIDLQVIGPAGALTMQLIGGGLGNRSGGSIGGPNGVPYEKYLHGTLRLICPGAYFPVDIYIGI